MIWSHSSARAVWNHPRNVPDDILKMIGEKKGKVDGVVMVNTILVASCPILTTVKVNFAPQFVAAEGNATVEAVADHVEHIGRIAGRR